MNPADLQLIKNYLLGGAAVGAGAGALTSLLNHLSTLQDNADEATSSAKDDDTLYINLRRRAATDPAGPAMKQASVLRGGLAMTGSVLAAGGTYALVRALYEKMKLKSEQRRLDEAQQAYSDVLDAAAPEKSAAAAAPQEGSPMGVLETGYSAPLAAALLLALGSGALTNKLLQKTFPLPKAKVGDLKPRRVVLRTTGEEDPGEEEQQKEAALDEAAQLAAGIVLALDEDNDVGQLAKLAMEGRCREFRDVLPDALGTTFDLVKSAAVTDDNTRFVGVKLARADAYVGNMFDTLLAAEICERMPHFVKLAQQLPEHVQDSLVRVMASFNQADRGALYLTKTAGMLEEMPGAALLAQLLAAGHGNQHNQAPQGDGTPDDGDDTPEGRGEAEVLPEDATAQEMLQEGGQDVIDLALNGPTKQKAEILAAGG